MLYTWFTCPLSGRNQLIIVIVGRLINRMSLMITFLFIAMIFCFDLYGVFFILIVYSYIYVEVFLSKSGVARQNYNTMNRISPMLHYLPYCLTFNFNNCITIYYVSIVPNILAIYEPVTLNYLRFQSNFFLLYWTRFFFLLLIQSVNSEVTIQYQYLLRFF